MPCHKAAPQLSLPSWQAACTVCMIPLKVSSTILLIWIIVNKGGDVFLHLAAIAIHESQVRQYIFAILPTSLVFQRHISNDSSEHLTHCKDFTRAVKVQNNKPPRSYGTFSNVCIIHKTQQNKTIINIKALKNPSGLLITNLLRISVFKIKVLKCSSDGSKLIEQLAFNCIEWTHTDGARGCIERPALTLLVTVISSCQVEENKSGPQKQNGGYPS